MIPNVFPNAKELLVLLALISLIGGGFIFVFIPWLWSLAKPLTHMATG